jgi:NitT/TauT family transport system ATP-binding protein
MLADLKPHDPATAVSLHNVALTYSGPPAVQALSAITAELAQGEFVSLIGSSGCGKSSLLRLVAGLLAPTSGEIHIQKKSAEAGHPNTQGIGFVFQHPTLLPWRTVLDNVRLPLELGKNYHFNSAAALQSLLELVGLREFAHAYPHQLSGGMQMRASVARALATRPGLLLLDEPFGALDDITRLRLNEELLDLWHRDRWTALFVTHNVSEAVFLSQRILLMTPRPGRLAAEIEIPFPYPRSASLRATPAFARLVGEISRRLLETAS